jgi:hypothetical protein
MRRLSLSITASVVAAAVLGGISSSSASSITASITANDDFYSTPVNTDLIVNASGILANDTSTGLLGGFSVFTNSDPSNAALFALFANGSFQYNPSPGFTGETTFTYQAGGVGASAPNLILSNVATVHIEVGATPLPAALPLFATGLGAIGLLGSRRKRKAQAGA